MADTDWWNESSVCSSGVSVDYYWHELSAAEPVNRHVDETVEKLMTAIRRPGRLWHPYTLISAEGKFRSRILRAMEGRLEPVDEVKRIRESHPAKLYEVRWQDIHVVDRGVNGPDRGYYTLVRLIHAEPESMPLTVIGLRAHEKIIQTDSGVGDSQHDQLGAATQTYWQIMSESRFTRPGDGAGYSTASKNGV